MKIHFPDQFQEGSVKSNLCKIFLRGINRSVVKIARRMEARTAFRHSGAGLGKDLQVDTNLKISPLNFEPLNFEPLDINKPFHPYTPRQVRTTPIDPNLNLNEPFHPYTMRELKTTAVGSSLNLEPLDLDKPLTHFRPRR